MNKEEGHACVGDSCEVRPAGSAAAAPVASPAPLAPSKVPTGADYPMDAFHKALQGLSKKIADSYQSRRPIPAKRFEDYVTRSKGHPRYASIMNTQRAALLSHYEAHKAFARAGNDKWLSDATKPVFLAVSDDIRIDVTAVYSKSADELKDGYFFQVYECLAAAGLPAEEQKDIRRVIDDGEASVVSTPAVKAAEVKAAAGAAGPAGAMPTLQLPPEMAGFSKMFEGLMGAVQRNVNPSDKTVSGQQIASILGEVMQNPEVTALLGAAGGLPGLGGAPSRLERLAAPLSERVAAPEQ